VSFGRLERPAGAAPISDINMTPLIDVMLVLVVIFIITAPLLASTLRLDLPRSGVATPQEAPDFVLVALDKTGQAYWADQPVSAAELARNLTRLGAQNPQAEVQLRADEAVPYGRVMQVLGAAQQAGLSRIGFVAEPAAGPTTQAR
jgi:biopolymer transport protein TolR